MQIRKALRAILVGGGYHAESYSNGYAGIQAVRTEPCDLLILDLMLPDVSGLEICRQVRAEQPDLPIMILTSVESEDTILEGFQSGSDDYVTKPFRMAELLARVRALLRRSRRRIVDVPQPFRFADWYIEPPALKASRGVEDLALTERECEILSLLVEHAGETVSRAQLLQRAWGFDNPERIETRRVDVQVAKLRKKLGSPAGQSIETVHGSGYRYYFDPNKLQSHQGNTASKRHTGRKKVMWFARWSSSEFSGTGVIRDASPDGAFLSLDNPEDLQRCPSESLAVQIYVPAGEPLQVRGRVRWRGWNSTHNCNGFGLIFSTANASLEALLHHQPSE